MPGAQMPGVDTYVAASYRCGPSCVTLLGRSVPTPNSHMPPHKHTNLRAGGELSGCQHSACVHEQTHAGGHAAAGRTQLTQPCRVAGRAEILPAYRSPG
jgi:hypothetical protein